MMREFIQNDSSSKETEKEELQWEGGVSSISKTYCKVCLIIKNSPDAQTKQTTKNKIQE